VIDNIEDQNSSYKRIVALETLIRLVTRTGYIVDPVIKYPKLLPIIIEAITTAHTGPTRNCSVR
jgi:FKBP12-rapamycin complex-associated protein